MEKSFSKSEINRLIDQLQNQGDEVLIGLGMIQLKQMQRATTDESILNAINNLIVDEDVKDSSFYWEVWRNPDTSDVEPVKVFEYTLQSFEEGIRVPRPGSDWAKRPDTGTYLIHRFEYSEYEKVKEAQKAHYHQKVSNETEVFKQYFNKRIDASGAKDLLIKSEINNFEKLLFEKDLSVHNKVSYVAIADIILPSNLGTMPVFPISQDEEDVPPVWVRYWERGIDNTRVLRYRNIFNRIIINGQRDYSVVNNNGSDIDFVRVEAIWNYLQWLKEGAGENESKDLPGMITEKHKKTFKEPLSVRQIALLHVYNGQLTTKENAEEIARNHGHKSGKHLLSRYGEYISTANRKGKPNPFTARKLENKIELLKSIIKLLPEDKISRAVDELKILESYKDELE